MGVSPTSSHVYINYTSLFAQGGNKSMASYQAAASSYTNGTFQVRSASMAALDVLDLSPEAKAWTKPTDTEDAAEQSEAVTDATLQSPEMSQAERVEIIRVNKNAVLARIDELFAEKGVEVSADQAFDLKVNFLDGSISVTGVEDENLEAAMNEALAGDEELIALMRKTRDELGLPDRENTVPRNFTIQFSSMLETPADAELEFKIDLFVNNPVPMLEDGTPAEDTEDGETASEPAKPTFQMSIVLSNRPQQTLLDQLESGDSVKSTNKKNKNEKAESDDETNEVEDEETVAASTEDEIEEEPDGAYSIFGNWFQAASTVSAGPDGLQLDWNLQFRNWDLSESAADSDNVQRVFETLNLGGTMQFGLDSTSSLTPAEQAARLESLFSDSMNRFFTQNTSSGWSFDFLKNSGLDQLGLFPS